MNFKRYLNRNYETGGIRLLLLFLLRSVINICRFWVYKLLGLKGGKLALIGPGFRIESLSGLELKGLNKIGARVKVVGSSKEKSKIGPNCSIGDGTIIYLSSGVTEFGEGLFMAEGSTCAENCVFGAAGGLKIGANVIMGQNVRLHSENHVYTSLDKPIKEQGVSRQGIVIEDDVWLGSGAVVLDGVKVAKSCIIGANAVVTKDTVPFGIYGGIPAKLMKMRPGA